MIAMAECKPKRGRPAAKQKAYKTLGYRVSRPYLEWLEQAAKLNRSSISGLIDQAVAKYAGDIGIAGVPPDRTA